VKKSELVSKIAGQNPHLTLKEVDKIVTVVFDEIIHALAAKNRVEFRGFGTFSVRSRGPRIAKNPKTGKKVEIGVRHIVHFKTGRGLLGQLNAKK